MPKIQFSASEKFAVLQEIESGQTGVKAAAKKYGISKTTLAKWRRRYEVYGYEGLEIQTRNRSYSADLKLQAVQDYLSGQYSQYEMIDKYKIASRTQLKRWLDKYNGHSSLQSYNEGAKAMTKGRATTWQERIDIVHYCLAHQHDYQKAAPLDFCLAKISTLPLDGYCRFSGF
ncbi:transposase [Brevibacterium sp. JNUCC-42]|nr:transposase [Brevibacterium sp. JNUCC-42]